MTTASAAFALPLTYIPRLSPRKQCFASTKPGWTMPYRRPQILATKRTKAGLRYAKLNNVYIGRMVCSFRSRGINYAEKLPVRIRQIVGFPFCCTLDNVRHL